jgi:anti-sigma factor RsiW
MSCVAYRERIEALVDGMLPAEEARELERHLEGCPSCAALARELSRLHGLLGASPNLEPSPGFEASFLRRLRSEAESRPSWWPALFRGWRGWAFATAAATAVALGLVLWPERPDRRPHVEPEQPAQMAEVWRRLDLLENLEVLAHLEILEGVTPEEFEAVAELPELGG